MLSFYLKRVIAVILLVIAVVGYSRWKDDREAEALAKSTRYAQVVAELAVAEALYHDTNDSADSTNSADSSGWPAVRDSLLHTHSLNSDSIDKYINSFEGHEEKLGAFWKRVRINVDSLAELELARLSPPPDSADTASDTTIDSSQTTVPDTTTTIRRQ